MESSALIESSPGVTALIRKYLGETALVALSAEYSRGVSNGGNREGGVIREDGVSFSPRLARIMTILIEYGGVRDCESLCFALRCGAVLCAPGGAPFEWASRKELRTAAGGDEIPDATIALVEGAYLLDAVRHLHMTPLSPELREVFLNDAEVRLRELVPGPSNSRVHQRVTHAIVLQRRRALAERARKGVSPQFRVS